MTTLTTQSATAIYAKYVAAWRAIPEDQREAIAADVIAEHVRYTTPRHTTGDRATVVEDMRAFAKALGHDKFILVAHDWGGGVAWIILVVGSIVVSVRNYRKTRSEISIALVISLAAVVMCATLHEGEHWRQMWLMFGLIWGLNPNLFEQDGKEKPKPQRLVRVQRAVAKSVAK